MHKEIIIRGLHFVVSADNTKRAYAHSNGEWHRLFVHIYIKVTSNAR